ncbi:MAG: hypothetical protein FJX75_21710 [Armatimonadetes bacterium]|nr:hypothetical protein [Armatimonadota bacterium]
MKYLLILGLLALPLTAFAATDSDTASVVLTIGAYGNVDLEAAITSDEFTNTAPSAGDVGNDADNASGADAVAEVDWDIDTNDDAWSCTATIKDGNNVANRLNNGAADTMEAVVIYDDDNDEVQDALEDGTWTGTNPGASEAAPADVHLTIIVDRDGLNDHSGTYTGTVTATLTYD